LLLFRRRAGELEVFLVHPGGPFWARKDEGAWMIPKGEVDEGEDALACARREFREETGFPIDGDFVALEEIRQKDGKLVQAWAVEADVNASAVKSNTFAVEVPRGSGRFRQYPEVDRAAWFTLADARVKLLKSQQPLLDQLERLIRHPSESRGPVP
jgi:predicted NUDIX family NTP pyrophosphohydrolase